MLPAEKEAEEFFARKTVSFMGLLREGGMKTKFAGLSSPQLYNYRNEELARRLDRVWDVCSGSSGGRTRYLSRFGRRHPVP